MDTLPADRWRTTAEEIDRLASCAACALWYTDSPGRSLALATTLAAERPLLLSYPSQMFEYLEGNPTCTGSVTRHRISCP